MLNNMHNLTDFYRSMLNLALMAIGEHPFVMKNARSLLFEGYKDQIFSLLQLVKNLVPAFAGMPDRMGFFYPQNLSCDGIYDIDSGIDNVDNVGKIWTWNGNSTLNYWFTKEANMINGSGAYLFNFCNNLCKDLKKLRLFLQTERCILRFLRNLALYECLCLQFVGK